MVDGVIIVPGVHVPIFVTLGLDLGKRIAQIQNLSIMAMIALVNLKKLKIVIHNPV